MKNLIFCAFCMISTVGYTQTYTLADTLRGSITPEREWWDLNYYHLNINVEPGDSTIAGFNKIRYSVLEEGQVLQIDLQDPMKITKILQGNTELNYEKIGLAHFVQLIEKQEIGKSYEITVHYEGKPHVAVRAPWDGGISWKTDTNGNPFVASSCQGIGASIWWPCKDHMYDEVDSMLMTISVPQGLLNVGNGKLRKKYNLNGKTITEWFVSNPINNYGVNINIGDYAHFNELYDGEKGLLSMDYYVLKNNLEIAKEHFKDAPRTIEALEHWFGPYPFYEDGYKLVEVPYLGMEHQSSVTYGNGYKNGYLGKDLSSTGWGLKFDFIIVHETGHEWFANNITYRDIADMWIHESFTAYSESLFLEYHYGKSAGTEYVLGTRSRINNDIPIIGAYGVNARGSGDMYYKGSNMLNSIRHSVDNDDLWRETLRGLNERFYHETVTTQEIEEYMSNRLGINLDPIFDQYLRDTDIPIFQYRIGKEGIEYRWSNVVDNFKMPIAVYIDGEPQKIIPTESWQKLHTSNQPNSIVVDKNYYIATLNITGE